MIGFALVVILTIIVYPLNPLVASLVTLIYVIVGITALMSMLGQRRSSAVFRSPAAPAQPFVEPALEEIELEEAELVDLDELSEVVSLDEYRRAG